MRQALRTMIDDTGTGIDCARAVMDYQRRIDQPWDCDEEAGWRRLRQCLNGTAGRHFEVDWYPIVARVVIYHGGEDVAESILSEVRYAARRDRERAETDGERERIHRVRPHRGKAEVA